jgi:hypothetical protein
MWTIARARAAGVLFALAALLVPFSGATGPQATTGPARVPASATPAAAAGGHHASDDGQLALLHRAPIPGISPERRGDRGGHGPALAAAMVAALVVARMLALAAIWPPRRRGSRRGGPAHASRAPPQLLSA